MKIWVIILVAIMLFVIGCEKPSELPTKHTARKAMLDHLGCQSGGWSSQIGDGVPVVDGRNAVITLPVRCSQKGDALHDFGESCHNLMGCCKLYLLEATCEAKLRWGNKKWNVSYVKCFEVKKTRKGSMACPEGDRR